MPRFLKSQKPSLTTRQFVQFEKAAYKAGVEAPDAVAHLAQRRPTQTAGAPSLEGLLQRIVAPMEGDEALNADRLKAQAWPERGTGDAGPTRGESGAG